MPPLLSSAQACAVRRRHRSALEACDQHCCSRDRFPGHQLPVVLDDVVLLHADDVVLLHADDVDVDYLSGLPSAMGHLLSRTLGPLCSGHLSCLGGFRLPSALTQAAPSLLSAWGCARTPAQSSASTGSGAAQPEPPTSGSSQLEPLARAPLAFPSTQMTPSEERVLASASRAPR